MQDKHLAVDVRHEGASNAAPEPTMGVSTESFVLDRSYRLYSLSASDSITGAESRQFGCDAEALLHAQNLLNRHPAVEIWQTDRFVCRLDRSVLMNRAA